MAPAKPTRTGAARADTADLPGIAADDSLANDDRLAESDRASPAMTRCPSRLAHRLVMPHHPVGSAAASCVSCMTAVNRLPLS
jgi:hypothetical protein